MSGPLEPRTEALPDLPPGASIVICWRYDGAWREGQKPPIEDFLAEVPEAERSALLRELLALELEYRRRKHEPWSLNSSSGAWAAQLLCVV
jgi:hypothetical protein